jgi:hypothetical protein
MALPRLTPPRRSRPREALYDPGAASRKSATAVNAAGRQCRKVVVMSYYPEPETVIGRSAYVTVAIPGGTKAGEVIIRVSGGTESYIAFADQPVEVGAQVVVVADRGARTLFVAPL